jgi:hypothetical protein
VSLVNEPVLLELFRSHGVEALAEGAWITFPGRPNLRASASVARETPGSSWLSVQLDVRLQLSADRAVCESFAGVGLDREQAVADGFRNFVANSFHVLLAAFFAAPEGGDDPQVSRERWAVGGSPARAVVGNVGVRGKPPVEGAALVAWYDCLRELIQGRQLRPGTHWVRLYYGQTGGKPLACEVLLDNDVWDEVQAEMAAFAWPAGDAFYSVRIFLVLDVGKGGAVTPEAAVSWLAEMVAPRQQFTEGEVFSELVEAGVPEALADRAFKFTQIVAGRALLAGIGVRFSEGYFCFDRDGEVVESGRLADEPCFAAASRLAERYGRTPGFLHLAMTSADLNAVNQALHAGSQPAELTTSPAGLFLEAPTPAGVAKAQETIGRMMQEGEQ